MASEPLYMKLNQRKPPELRLNDFEKWCYEVLPYLLLSLDLIIAIFNLLFLHISESGRFWAIFFKRGGLSKHRLICSAK